MLVHSLSSNFRTSIVTNSFQAPFIRVGHGVLQGDCLSPLTFNLCFNTFIRYISDQKFKEFGLSTSSLFGLVLALVVIDNMINIAVQNKF